MAKALFGIVKRSVGNKLTIKLNNGDTVKYESAQFKFGDRVQVAMDWQAGRVRKVYPAKIVEDNEWPEGAM